MERDTSVAYTQQETIKYVFTAEIPEKIILRGIIPPQPNSMAS